VIERPWRTLRLAVHKSLLKVSQGLTPWAKNSIEATCCGLGRRKRRRRRRRRRRRGERRTEVG
jgi:hypothetical protein